MDCPTRVERDLRMTHTKSLPLDCSTSKMSARKVSRFFSRNPVISYITYERREAGKEERA